MQDYERAKNLLSDEFFTSQMQKLKDIEMQKILNSQPLDIDERELAYSRITALQSIIAHFEGIAATSEILKKRWKIL